MEEPILLDSGGVRRKLLLCIQVVGGDPVLRARRPVYQGVR